MYNYEEAVKEDVLQYIRDEIDFSEFDTLDDLEEFLNERLWTNDSVTGNASGSYTFSTYDAEENLCHNLELLEEALREFGCTGEYLLTEGPEAADVTIRCYLLSGAISEALEEIKNEFEEAHEKDN